MLETRNVLDCDQSNYSSRIIFSYTFTLEPNTYWTGWTVSEIWALKKMQETDRRDLEFGPTGSRDIRSADRTKREVNCVIRCRNLAIPHFLRWRPAAILDFLKSEVASLDPPTSKTLPYRTKHEVDRMTRCRDMAVRNFPKCEVGRSVVGPQCIHCSHPLLFATLGT